MLKKEHESLRGKLLTERRPSGQTKTMLVTLVRESRHRGSTRVYIYGLTPMGAKETIVMENEDAYDLARYGSLVIGDSRGYWKFTQNEVPDRRHPFRGTGI